MKLRILSWNIHKGIGGIDRRYDLSRIADLIIHEEPDIVLLQEVAASGKRFGDHRQADEIAQRTGMPWATYFTNVRWKNKGEYGNAVLSRHRITGTVNVDVTIPFKKRRSILHACCRLSREGDRRVRTLHVFNGHLGLSGIEREMQLKRFMASAPFAHLKEVTPVVFAGDFNDVWGTLGKKILVPAGMRGPERPLRTFPAYAPVRALDSLYVRGRLEIESLRRSRLALARTASDHQPLVADLVVRDF